MSRTSARSTISSQEYTKTSHERHKNGFWGVSRPPSRERCPRRSADGGAQLEALHPLLLAERKLWDLVIQSVVESACAVGVARHRSAARRIGERPLAQRIVLEHRRR